MPQGDRAGKTDKAGVGPDHAGLAALLGQALVELEGFEAAWSGHSDNLGYAVWDVPGPAPPVKRLLPKNAKAKKLEPQGEMTKAQMREKLTHIILTRYAACYDEGYAAAKAGGATICRPNPRLGVINSVVGWCPFIQSTPHRPAPSTGSAGPDAIRP